MLARSAAFALADFFQQFDLNLLNFEDAIVLVSQEMIDFLVQVPNLEFGLEIDLVIILRLESIASFRAVLAHHNGGRLQCSQAGEDEIKENKRVGIERARGEKNSINDDPDDQDAAESDDKLQAPAKLCDLMNSASEGRRLSPIAPFCGMNARPQIWQFSFRGRFLPFFSN